MSTNSSDGSIDFALYRYTPSIPAAVVFAVMFFIITILHCIRLWRYRAFFFVPFIIGLLFECAGYIARIFSHFDTKALGPYIVQTMLILVAPPLFAASIYMTLGRVIVALHCQELSIVPVRFLTKIFVVGDVISFLLQCGGGGYMAAGSVSAMNTGANIVIGGLAIQLLFFGFFVIVSAVFHWRVKRNLPSTSHSREQGKKWESIMWALYASCFLILVRSIFRVAEFVEGNDGFIMRREYLLYIFDACLMALSGIVLVVVYPGSFLGHNESSRDSALQLILFVGTAIGADNHELLSLGIRQRPKTIPLHPMQVEDTSRSAAKLRVRPKQRISHTKSRNGCYTCKQRRVKCDEERPTCGSCLIRGEECVFPNPVGTRDQRRRPPIPHHTPALESVHLQARENGREVPFRPLHFNVPPSEGPQNAGVQPQSDLNMTDLNLLQHFILHTSRKMTLNKIKMVVWERVIPEMAAANQFLMHLVLALAGLDILTTGDAWVQHTQGPSGASIPANLPQFQSIVEHHQKGLAGLQEALCAISEPNVEVLLAGSLLVVAFAFASLGNKHLDTSLHAHEQSPNSGVDSISAASDIGIPQIQWLRLVRGVTSILRQFWPTLRKCRLRELINCNNANEDWKMCEAQLRCSNPVPSWHIRSKRLRKFATGANHAVSDLWELHASLRPRSDLEEGAEGSPSSATPRSDESGDGSKAYLDMYEQAIGVVEDLYMRILYVMQMRPLESHPSSDLELEANLEEAAISGWPHLVSEEFVSSLDSHGKFNTLQGVSLVILAHLYVPIAMVDEPWYFGKRWDIEIQKMSTVIVGLADPKFMSLMEWPMDVIR
ncbi:Protein RTM1 [Penicillium rolfsii]|nr:Protein RTM1 [Penicillium rolfsii]